MCGVPYNAVVLTHGPDNRPISGVDPSPPDCPSSAGSPLKCGPGTQSTQAPGRHCAAPTVTLSRMRSVPASVSSLYSAQRDPRFPHATLQGLKCI